MSGTLAGAVRPQGFEPRGHYGRHRGAEAAAELLPAVRGAHKAQETPATAQPFGEPPPGPHSCLTAGICGRGGQWRGRAQLYGLLDWIPRCCAKAASSRRQLVCQCWVWSPPAEQAPQEVGSGAGEGVRGHGARGLQRGHEERHRCSGPRGRGEAGAVQVLHTSLSLRGLAAGRRGPLGPRQPPGTSARVLRICVLSLAEGRAVQDDGHCQQEDRLRRDHLRGRRGGIRWPSRAGPSQGAADRGFGGLT